jgi:hypothetical protein
MRNYSEHHRQSVRLKSKDVDRASQDLHVYLYVRGELMKRRRVINYLGPMIRNNVIEFLFSLLLFGNSRSGQVLITMALVADFTDQPGRFRMTRQGQPQ